MRNCAPPIRSTFKDKKRYFERLIEEQGAPA